MPCVYILYSEDAPDEPRYVGISKHDLPETRLRHHIYESNRGTKRPVYNWMRSIQNKVVAVAVLTEISWEDACKNEILMIANLKNIGHRLLNLTAGGEGNLNPSAETRRKISDAHRGKVISKDMKKHLSQINTGKKHSEETKRKMSESHMGINTWAKGTKLSDERRAQISEGLKGRPVSDETKKKLSESNVGKKRTPEQKENMRKAQEARRKRELKIKNEGQNNED